MSTTLLPRAYDGLCDEDIQWLKDNTEKCLEQDHIIQIIEWSKRNHRENYRADLHRSPKESLKCDKLALVREYVERESHCGVMRSMNNTVRATAMKDVLNFIDELDKEQS